MKGLIGKKVGMTQYYTEAGKLIPVTVIQAGPSVVVDVKTQEKHGYSALQLGFGCRKAKNVSKAMLTNFERCGRKDTPPAIVREVRLDADPQVELGSEVKATIFAANEYLDVTGVSKGRGFAGVVKRHHFQGGRAGHAGGWVRKPGSMGCRETPGNVIKNKRLPGHMGNATCTMSNLQVVRVVEADNLIYVKGAVPGPNGGIVMVKSAKKKAELSSK